MKDVWEVEDNENLQKKEHHIVKRIARDMVESAKQPKKYEQIDVESRIGGTPAGTPVWQ